MNGSKIVMCATTGLGLEILDHLAARGIRPQHIVGISEETARKNKVSGYVSFEKAAAKHGIPLYICKSYALTHEDDLAFFREQKFDLLIQGGWQRLFPGPVLDTLRVGAVGIHGSSEFLPLGRGRSPINWSLIEGKKRFIFHYFVIRPGVDDGDVFHFDIVDINEWDSCETMYHKYAVVCKRAMADWIPRLLAGDFKALPQTGEPSYYPKRTAEDGRIDWTKTVFELHNFVRALTRPYPGAFCLCGDKQLLIWEAQPFDTRITYPDAAYGEVVEVFGNGEAVVNCRSGLLLLRDHEGAELRRGQLLT